MSPFRSIRTTSSGASLLLLALALSHSAQTIGDWPDVAAPPGNPITPEKALLGKALFFEEQLSVDSTVACATCHLPEAGGGENRTPGRHPGIDETLLTEDDEFGSLGVLRQDREGAFRYDKRFQFERQSTARNSPSVYGAAFLETLFWDGRAGQEFRDLDGNVVLPELAALETQAVAPLTSRVEMANEGRSWEAIIAKLGAARPLALAWDIPADLGAFVDGSTYGELFALAFGTEEITRERIAMAIATYERTLVPDRTPFDLGTMTSEQELGLQVFSEARCAICHVVSNSLFTDGRREVIGLPGHSRATKIPGLRNVGLRRRLMSSGQFTDIGQVLDHYERVGFLPSALKAEERAALLVFLEKGLTDGRVERAEPPFDRPRLHSERMPVGGNLFGEAWPGASGVSPELIAHSPAHIGNADFKIGIGNAPGGAPSFLLLATHRARPGLSFRGAPLHVSLVGAQVLTQPLSGVGARRGVATYFLPVPPDPALVGARRFAQGFVVDPDAEGGLSATVGAEIVAF